MARIRQSSAATGTILTIREALERAETRPVDTDSAIQKKNYAERLSRNLATCFANGLRLNFPGILPDEQGFQQESVARAARGPKTAISASPTTLSGMRSEPLSCRKSTTL